MQDENTGTGNVLQRNPAVVWPLLGSLISAILWQYFPDMGESLISAIVEFIAVALPVLIGIYIARQNVTPVKYARTDEGEDAIIIAKNDARLQPVRSSE